MKRLQYYFLCAIAFLLVNCARHAQITDNTIDDGEVSDVLQGDKSIFDSIKNYILHDDKVLLSKHVKYPFWMEFPLKSIDSETEFIQKFDMIFDEEVKKIIRQITVEDISENGYYSRYDEKKERDFVIQLADYGIAWMQYDTEEVIKERNKVLNDIRDVIDSEGEPIGCYISEDSAVALILEKFFEDSKGEYGRAYVYHKDDMICSQGEFETYHGRLTYQGASSYPTFTMLDMYGNSWINLEGGRAGNISTLWMTSSDWPEPGYRSKEEIYGTELNSIYYYDMLNFWNKGK